MYSLFAHALQAMEEAAKQSNPIIKVKENP
jgi:hypothetical protein